jgi:molybdenum cofactor cytidylyltransferase
MKQVTLATDAPWDASLVGAIACHDIRRPSSGVVVVRKGERLSEQQLVDLTAMEPLTAHVLVPEGELSEDEAAVRLGAALAGTGVARSAPHFGTVFFNSGPRGFFRVNETTLDLVNEHADVLAFTAESERPVDAGASLGGVKVAPLLLAREVVEWVESVCREHGPALEVEALPQRRVALVGTHRLAERARERATQSLTERVGWHGSAVDQVHWVPADPEQLADVLRSVRANGTDVVLVATASATDPRDAVFQGLEQAGGEVTRIGIPLEPGTACWTGSLGEAPVFGLASCELFGTPGAFDVILPHLLRGDALDNALLRRLARGGLVKGGPGRIPVYAPEADGDGSGSPA